MNAEQKDQIRELHSSGLGYKKIAAQLGLSVNTVASFCKEPFFAYPSSHRKYCSRLCYGKHRKEMTHGKRTLP